MRYENQKEMNAALISITGIVLIVIFNLLYEIVFKDTFTRISFFLLSLTFIFSGIYAQKTGYILALKRYAISQERGKFAKQLGGLSIIVGVILFIQMFLSN